MSVRDHAGVPLDKFNGLWNSGDKDTVPIDHFSDCSNIDFIAQSSFKTRPGIGISQDVLIPLSNVKRIYNYPTQTANTLIALTYDPDTNVGSIYHIVNSTLIYGPILNIVGMTDFAFQPYAGRGYISPFGDYINGDLVFQKGLAGEFLYVYSGNGDQARKAAGAGMSGSMTIAYGAPGGHTDAGFHIFGFVSQTISGFNSPPSVLTGFNTVATNGVSFGNIPTSGDPSVVRRLLVATKAISTYNGDIQGYEFFFVPNAIIENNTDTFLNNISFFDSELLEDASHLLQNYTSVPAGSFLTLYHNRLILGCTDTDISIMLVSEPGEPEAFNQITGLIVVPLDGNPLTNAQEMRDVLYAFKRARTVAFADNGLEPSSWPLIPIDSALGTSVHGIATVLDSGASTVDFLIIATYQGISKFNGRYEALELSWKIDNYWERLDRNKFQNIQILNAPISKMLYIVLPNRQLLVCNYGNGMDWKNVRWCPWNFRMGVNTIAIQNTDEIIFGADLF